MIAVSITAHENPRVIMEILSNIKYCYNENAVMVVHISADSKEAFYRHAAAKMIRLHDSHILWNDLEIQTKWGNALPMQISNYLYLKTQTEYKFSHFQILSPANLVIARDIDKYISAYDIVMRRSHAADVGWMWEEKAKKDSKFDTFREQNGLGERLCARVDGLAVRDAIFGDFVRRVLHIYSLNDMYSIDPIYPQEETLLPTFLERYRNFGYSFGMGRAKTFEPNEPVLDVKGLKNLVEQGEIAYLKRIPPQVDDPVRAYILKNFSYGRL